MEKEERILLPASVNPVSYEITLDPDFNGEKFEGFVRISDLTGLYQASYETDDGVKHPIAATAMEPTYRRSTIPRSVFCPLGGEEEATFAVNLAAKGPQFFEDCFELLYPLPKPDLIGVLEFSTGAMEDWGAIILRTTNLLLDPKDSALDTMQKIAGTILHEISHMWLDDLIYDEISYQKGSCILRMVLNSLGDTKFFGGLKLYHRRHQFQCTESDGLWKAREEVIGGSIEASMKVYTKYPGFPVLRVSESHDESGNLTGVGLFHHSFLTSGVSKEEDAPSFTVLCTQSVYKFHGAELNESLWTLASDVIDPKAVELEWTISKDDHENRVTFKAPIFSECLGRASTAELMKWVLGQLLTDTAVENHDMFYLSWLAGGTAHGAIEFWEWTKENWERVEKEAPVDIASLFLGML
ncbi:hypothetical protein FPRO04_04468 [Fusarium proliferatum]|nr:hypothetical protein FPRO03_02667 [Fusarium proliferatum]KAG4268052.1 hypothetical protein FPRO04_04468 [Fusarium proliferatum]